MIRQCLFQSLLQLLAIALILFGLGQFPALAERQNHHSEHFQTSSQFTQKLKIGMEKMMTDMHKLDITGNPDADFLAMMIPHHEGAVEMARLVLLCGKDPLVRKLAEEIIASQQVEVAAMQARLLMLKKGEDLDPEGFPAVHGTRGIGTSNSLFHTHFRPYTDSL